MSEVVTYSMAGDIDVVTIDSPPVNAIDRFIRAGLKQVFAELAGRWGVKAIVLGCRGKTFVAGADRVRHRHRQPRLPRSVSDDRGQRRSRGCRRARNGVGAGTEIALACHYRVAHEGARFGLPDSEIDRSPIAACDQTESMPLAATTSVNADKY